MKIHKFSIDRMSGWQTTAEKAKTGINSPGVTDGIARHIESIGNVSILSVAGVNPNGLAYLRLGGTMGDGSATAGKLSIKAVQQPSTDGKTIPVLVTSVGGKVLQMYIDGQLQPSPISASSGTFYAPKGKLTVASFQAWSGNDKVETFLNISDDPIDIDQITEATLVGRFRPHDVQPFEIDALDLIVGNVVSYPTFQVDPKYLKKFSLWNHAKGDWDIQGPCAMPTVNDWNDLTIVVGYNVVLKTHTFQQINLNGQQLLSGPKTYPFASGNLGGQTLAGLMALTQRQLDGPGVCEYQFDLIVKEN